MTQDRMDRPTTKLRKQRDWSGAAIGLCLGLVAMILSRFGWLRMQWDFLSAFTVQAAMLSTASIIGLLVPRFKTLVTSIFFIAGLLAYGLLPSLPVTADSPAPEGSKRLRVATFNIRFGKDHTEAILASLRSLDADVVILAEFDGTATEMIKSVQTQYPFFQLCERLDYCDTAIASRFAFKPQNNMLVQDGPAMTAVRLGPEFANTLIVGVHTARFPHPAHQNTQMAALTQRLSKETGAMIVAGDFNATAYSRLLQEFAKSLDLTIATSLPSFPSKFGLPQLAIDQIMPRSGIVAIGPQMAADAAGSHHIPLARSFAIPIPR